jgi:tetratricopeptide (TPR) repeat protein
MRSQVNAEQVMTIGRNVLSMDEYILAIHYFNLAIKAKPYMAEPYYFRGLAKLMLDDYKGAEEDCSEAISRNKFITEAYKVRGFARQRLDKDSLALLDYKQGLSYSPIDKYFLYYKGSAETTLKHYEAADSTFSTLLRYYPRFDGAYSERARLNLQRGDTVQAIDDLDTAIKLNKNETYPYLMRAEVKAAQHLWEEARDDMDRTIELLPKETGLYINRAYIRYNADDYFGAMSDYNYALELEPDNMIARYNRALLRYEIRDLYAAEEDFTAVLKQDPDNFHARYSRALIDMELNRNKQAVADLNLIAKKYPKFHNVYYALSQAYNNMGNNAKAIENYNKANNLVRAYVDNPHRNTLERPEIQAVTTNTSGYERHEDETDQEVMERFNQLVTVSSTQVASETAFKEGTKGKLQDRDMRIEPEPMYAISIYDNLTELRNSNNYFKELAALNKAAYNGMKLYLTNNPVTPTDRDDIDELFNIANSFSDDSSSRPVDYLDKGVALFLLKDYDAAVKALDKSLELKKDFTVAYMLRGYVKYMQGKMEERLLAENSDDKDSDMKHQMAMASATASLQSAMEDFDHAIEYDPSLVYAWFNRGCIYYELEDFTSALSCFSKALELNADFGEAYFNRGLTYLRLGNKNSGRSDLSKAGELGVMPSYNVLKKMM